MSLHSCAGVIKERESGHSSLYVAGFVLVVDELIQQLAVAHAGFIGKGRSAKILDNFAKPVNRHVYHPRAESLPTSYCPARRVFIGYFSGLGRAQGPRHREELGDKRSLVHRVFLQLILLVKEP
jgi:hypothetical protein